MLSAQGEGGGGGVVTVSLGLHRSDCVGVGSLTPRLAAAQGEGGGGAAALAQLAPLARVAWRALLGLRCSARVGWRCWLALLGWRRRWLALSWALAGAQRSLVGREVPEYE